MEGLRAQLNEQLNQFVANHNSGNGEACAAIYTPDCRVMPHGQPTLDGQPTLAHLFPLLISKGDTWCHEGVEDLIQVTPDVVITYSLGTSTDGASGQKTQTREVVVWKQIEGRWLIHWNMFNIRP